MYLRRKLEAGTTEGVDFQFREVMHVQGMP